MEVIRHAELIVKNGSFGQLSTPTVHLIIQSNVSPITGFVRYCMPDEACDGLYAWRSPWWGKRCFELTNELLVCSIVQRNHSILLVVTLLPYPCALLLQGCQLLRLQKCCCNLHDWSQIELSLCKQSLWSSPAALAQFRTPLDAYGCSGIMLTPCTAVVTWNY